MTKEMYEDLFERNRLQISEPNTLVEEGDKRIIELEKENEELRTEMQNLEGIKLAQETALSKEYTANEYLQKENAELKEKLGNVQMQKAGEKSDLVWKLKTANEQKTDKLTKAKEIIFTLLNNFAYLIGREDWTVEDVEIVDKAEQFLKEADSEH